MFTTYRVPPVRRQTQRQEVRPLTALIGSLRRRVQHHVSDAVEKTSTSKKNKAGCASGNCDSGLHAA